MSTVGGRGAKGWATCGTGKGPATNEVGRTRPRFGRARRDNGRTSPSCGGAAVVAEIGRTQRLLPDHPASAETTRALHTCRAPLGRRLDTARAPLQRCSGFARVHLGAYCRNDCVCVRGSMLSGELCAASRPRGSWQAGSVGTAPRHDRGLTSPTCSLPQCASRRACERDRASFHRGSEPCVRRANRATIAAFMRAKAALARCAGAARAEGIPRVVIRCQRTAAPERHLVQSSANREKCAAGSSSHTPGF